MAFLIQRAHLLLQQGRVQDAVTTLRQHLSTYANDIDGLYLLAICFLELGNVEEAESIISNAIGMAPADDRFYYIRAQIAFNKSQYNAAITAISEAVSIDPNVAGYFGMWSQILIIKRDFKEALEKAEEGLALDPENETCLNLRSTALFNLGKKEEAFSDLHIALEHNPENAYTHANLGWKLLENGDHKKALEHFREALKIDPNQQWAKSGMVQAMQARYWLFRMFLKYQFFMGRLSSGMQWGVIIGLFIITRLASTLFFPLAVLLAVMAVSTWLIGPVSNLFLRLNPYGRYALTKEQTQVSSMVGVLMAVAIVAGFSFWLTNFAPLLALAISSAIMLLPVSSIYSSGTTKGRRIFLVYTLTLSVLSVAGITWTFFDNDPFNICMTVMVIGVFIYQLMANFVLTRER
ncbi:lipopolysaccharide assembly protein LapB [Chitinophaga sp. Cy-1792]|uniref:tetratricopeptide repeat protein n=1 Tax=Chitinophaga sp. Cy-1792 TaxID=2608339 RepID=UPI001423D94E|nr:tetratricopeptide repeat protein [Chitinophaga sp. Cy-1792]NIG52753.1 tetratricopeptide repeat protein [Chitinophaga sp. Cy-1792]